MTNGHEDNDLPPKTGSVDQLVTLQGDIDKVVAGKKTATRRNGRFADVGEVMNLQGIDFAVERVYRQALGELTEENAREEGYANLEEYKQSIISLHPGMPWLPHMKVWVHEFRRVQP